MRPPLFLLLLMSAISCAQPQSTPPSHPPAPVIVPEPEVHPDHAVTFQFLDPHAKEVKLELEGAQAVPMQKNDQGVWSVTTGPLTPDFYGYAFVADGVSLIDPSNSLMKPNLIKTESEVHVPGPPTLPWEVNGVLHGTVHHHFYTSRVVGDERDFYVYTPAGYDPRSAQTYPVFYLLHGFSDDASGWTAVGRAHVILDNLIAQGKAKPMIVVMPLGYGAPEMVLHGFGAFSNTELRDRNFKKFSQALLTEVMPQVEVAYLVTKDRNSRAIAGLSMGGSESLLTGLNALDKFAWIGAFSSGGLAEDFNSAFPGLDSKANQQIRVLWIACGTDDHLIDLNRRFRAWLSSKGVRHGDVETSGGHTWMVWRRNLSEFAPLLFR